MKNPCERGSISESNARRIERQASAIRKREHVSFARALTLAARSVLRCRAPRAIGAEGSLNYIQRVVGGRVIWDAERRR